MSFKKIDGYMLSNMIRIGATNLTKNVDKINTLNVFPVPDGDTGTNMNLSFTSGVNEINKTTSSKISDVTKHLSKGLLMGARGNSGVILSQLFRGFSKAVEEKDELTVDEFSKALLTGVETAYKSVIKPIEGTILTVAKDTANAAVKISEQTDDFVTFMIEIVKEAKASLNRTPDYLPILKQVGVVDSGGQGLVCVYEGFLAALTGEEIQYTNQSFSFEHDKKTHVHDEVAELMADGILSVDEIKFGYCTEFMILLKKENFNEHLFREQLNRLGDSTLVISDDEVVKVHIHAENLSEVMKLAQKYGELTNIKIENMREQFRKRSNNAKPKEIKEIGVVSVGAGEGIRDLFIGLGVDEFILGGQTMNPSTEDIVKAIDNVASRNIFVLPNNSNIIMTAEQSAELSDKNVIVIPTKTIQQGMAAMLQFLPGVGVEKNKEEMTSAIKSVISGQVTHAVRDTEIDGVKIKKGHFMGIKEGKIISTNIDIDTLTKELIDQMIDENSEMVTVLYGEDVSKQSAEKLKSFIEKTYPDVETEFVFGGQPLYPYLLSVE